MITHLPKAFVAADSAKRLERFILQFQVLISILALMALLTIPPLASASSLAEVGQTPTLVSGPRPPTMGALAGRGIDAATPGGAQVCGEISADEVWTAAIGLYTATCDVHVSTGVTLKIEPGVVVQFLSADDDLIVSGTLNATGLASAPIVFQPTAGTEPGSWGRVAFLADSSGVLDHARLEYGGHKGGLLYLGSEHVQVLNSVVQYSADTGIVIQTTERGSQAFLPSRGDQKVVLHIAQGDIVHTVFLPSVQMSMKPEGPVISNTQVLSNTGIYGGGLYNESGDPVIDGNTFEGNIADGIPWTRAAFGAGLYNKSGNPLIQNNTFTNNGRLGLYAYGGGLFNSSGNPRIEGNTFSGNVAGFLASGGGLYNESGNPVIVDNTFTNNHAEEDGGGMLNNTGIPVIRDNRFIGNSASGRETWGHGGGLASRGGQVMIENNLFAENQVSGIVGPGFGGGVYNEGSGATIRNNVFRKNVTDGYGGGLFNSGSNSMIENNFLVENMAHDGGGLGNSLALAVIRNNTFARNTATATGGGFASLSSSPFVYNNIFFNNSAQTGGGLFVDTGILLINYNDMWMNTGGDYAGVDPGEHDLAADPLFVDAAAGDFHLRAGSPCIDAGDPLHYPPTDFDNDLRPAGAGPDIGADEFQPAGVFRAR